MTTVEVARIVDEKLLNLAGIRPVHIGTGGVRGLGQRIAQAMAPSNGPLTRVTEEDGVLTVEANIAVSSSVGVRHGADLAGQSLAELLDENYGEQRSMVTVRVVMIDHVESR